jgi:hypothetical protein
VFGCRSLPFGNFHLSASHVRRRSFQLLGALSALSHPPLLTLGGIFFCGNGKSRKGKQSRRIFYITPQDRPPGRRENFFAAMRRYDNRRRARSFANFMRSSLNALKSLPVHDLPGRSLSCMSLPSPPGDRILDKVLEMSSSEWTFVIPPKKVR